MCNLYANTMPQAAMRDLLKVMPDRDRLGNAAPLAAIFPRHDAPVARLDADGEREIRNMHWGFVLPRKSKKTGAPIQPRAVNNARDDKVRSSGFWKRHFSHRRCLVPATSFCEAMGRQPADLHWFDVDGGAPFAFAGIWSRYEGPYKDEPVAIETYSILTTTPNSVVAPVHPTRMTVILDSDDHDTWLTGTEDEAAGLLRPFPAERMRVRNHGAGMNSEPAVSA